MKVTRIDPRTGLKKKLNEFDERLRNVETRPSGSSVVRDGNWLKTYDPITGVETIIGQLPDGSYGIQPFVGDTEPPPVPTAPIATTQPGTITVYWDGAFVASAQQPRDFEHVNVYGHKVVGGIVTSTVECGVIRLGNESVIITTDVAGVGETWKFSFTSEDYNKNNSVASAFSPTVTMLSMAVDSGINDALEQIQLDIVSADSKAVSAQSAASTAQTAADAAAAKVTAAIASGSSLTINGDFEQPNNLGWMFFSGTSIEASTGTARSGTKILRGTLSSGQRYAYTDYIQGATNRTYYVEFYVRLRETLVSGNEALQMGAFFSYLTTNGTNSAAVTYGTGYGATPLTLGDLSTTVWKKFSTSYTFTTPDISTVRFGPRFPGTSLTGNTLEIDDFKVIDVTEASLAQTKADQAFNNAVTASTAAGTAQTTADSKNRSWNQTTPPAGTSHKEGDLWFDTDDGNKLYLWKTSTNTWTPFQDGAIATLQAAVTAVTQTANGKNNVYYQPAQPSGGSYIKGDLWFDSDDNYKLYTYTGSAWQPTQDAAGALSVATGKNNSFLSATAPTASAVGDLWIDTANGNQIKRWNGSTWADARDTTIAAAQTAANTAQTTANGKNTSYYQTTQPSGGTYRAGDLWFDTDDNYKLYTYTGSTWQLAQDAKAASDLAAGKNQTFIAPTAPTANAVGDIWIDTANGNQLKRWNGSAWNDARDTTIATAQSTANTALTSANGKNKVIHSTSVASGSAYASGDTWFQYDGSNNIIGQWAFTTSWQPRQLDSAVFANIDAGKIAVNTLDGNRIIAGSIQADRVMVGSGQNLAYNGSAEINSTIGYSGFIRATTAPPTGYPAYWTTTAGQSATFFLNQPAVKVKPNTQYRISVWVKADKAGSKTYLEPITGSTATGERTNPIYAFTALDVPTVWTRWTSVVTTGTAPLNTLNFRWYVNHPSGTVTDSVFSFTGFELYEMNTGELIVDGAIQAGSAIIGTGAIGTAQIGEAQIKTANIDNLAVTDAKIDTVDVGKVVAGWLQAGVIKAGAIQTSMLSVSDITNFAPSYAESPNDWVIDSPLQNVVTGVAAAIDKRRFSLIDNTGIAKLARGPLYAVQPGDELYAEGTIYRTGVTTNNISLRYYFYDNVKAFISSASLTLAGAATATNSPNATFQQIKATVPSGAMYSRLALVITNSTNDDIGMYNIRGYRRNKGELIVDGAITAGSAIIATAAIDGAQIKNTTITDANIQSLNAGKIIAGLLDAARIDAGTISADKLITGIGNNLVGDPNFANATVQARRKTVSDSATAGTWTVDAANQLVTLTTGATPGQLQWRLRDSISGNTGAPYPIDSGRRYNITFDVFRPTGSSPAIRSNIYYKKQDGSFAYVTDGMSNVTPPTSNAWNTVSRVWTPPADAVAFGVDLVVSSTSGNTGLQFRSPSVRAMSNATLIEDGAIVTTHMTAGTIDGSIISVNTLNGSAITAKTIKSDRLVITSTDNLVVEADFSNGGTSWGTLNANKVINATAGRGGGPALRITGTTSLQTVTNLVNKVTVGSEDRFRGSFYVKSSASTTAGAYKLRMNQYTTASSSTAATIASSPALVANTWTLVEGYSPALPAGTIALEFFLEATNAASGTNTDFDYVAVTRAADGKLVVDGAIDGKIITGATFQTTSLANRGIKLYSDPSTGIGALEGYDSAGNKNFNLTTAGALTITGATMKTATTGSRVEIDPTNGMRIFDSSSNLLLTASGAGVSMTGQMIARGTIATYPTSTGLSTIVGPMRWSVDDDATTPAIYFLKDGNVIHSQANPTGFWAPSILTSDGNSMVLNGSQTLALPEHKAQIVMGFQHPGNLDIYGTSNMTISTGTSYASGTLVLNAGNSTTVMLGALTDVQSTTFKISSSNFYINGT
jgi:hypothetical protein